MSLGSVDECTKKGHGCESQKVTMVCKIYICLISNFAPAVNGNHPDVSEVQVFGVPDTRLGEEVCAWVVAKTSGGVTGEALRVFCDGQIAHFKVPRHIRIVDELPMTITGKPQKFVMRDRMIEELGGGSAD